MSSQPADSSFGQNKVQYVWVDQDGQYLGEAGSKADVQAEVWRQVDEMKRQREDWLKYMDGMIKETVEDAFAQGIFPISHEVWDTVNGRKRKTHISWIQYMALGRRVYTLDAVEREVAKSRQEPDSSVIQENVNNHHTITDAPSIFNAPHTPSYVTSSIADSFHDILAKKSERILSKVLILEYVEVELMANESSSQNAGTEGESTKAVKDLLLAWGPITSKRRWDFIRAQDGYDDYAEISEGQLARFGHLLV